MNRSDQECESQLPPKAGAILTRDEAMRMETRVMSMKCTDADFRLLMDSHESLRNIVKWYTDSALRPDRSKPTHG